MKLELSTLYMKDFKNVKEALIDFPAGKIVYFSGNNAQGKSTVLEALALVLGDFRKGDTYKDFINWDDDSSKKAEIKFTGKVNEEPILLSVEITEGNSALVRYCEYKGKKKNGSDVLALLSHLEVDYFSNIIFYLQSTSDITKMSPSELAKSLQKLLNFSTDKYLKILEDLIKPAETKRMLLDHELCQLKEKEYSEEKEYPKMEVSEEESNKASEEVVKLSEQLSKKLQQLELQKQQVQEKENLHQEIESCMQEISAKEVEKSSLKEVDLTLIEEKKKTIEKDYQTYQQVQEKVKNIQTDSLTTRFETLTEKEKSLEEELKNCSILRIQANQGTQLKERGEKLQSQIQEIDKVLVKNSTQFQQLQDQISQEQEKLKDIFSKKEQVAKEIPIQRETQRVARLIQEGKCPHCGQSTEKIAHSIKFEDTLGWLGKTENEIKECIFATETLLSNLKNEEKTLTQKIKALEEKKVSIQTAEQLKTKEKEDKIFEKNKIDEEIQQFKNNGVSLEEIEQKEQEAVSALKSLKEELKTTQTQLHKFQIEKEVELSRVKTLLDKYQLTEEESTQNWSLILKQVLSEEVEEANKETAQAKKMLDQAIESLKEHKKGLEKQLEDLKKAVQENQEDTNISEIQKAIQDHKEKIEKRKIYLIEFNNISEYNSKLNAEKEKDKATQESHLKEIQELTDRLALYESAKTKIGKDLPNYLTVKMCSTLERIINDFLQVVFPEMTVQLEQNKKGVSFFYRNTSKKTRKNVTVKMASGMEAQVLSIAWRVALSRAYSLNILLLDEVDSAAANESSLKIFGELFSDKSFDQFVVISHKQEVIRELQNDFDNIICYKVENGKFSLEV